MELAAKRPNPILRYQRQKRGWSQQRVAELLDTSENVVSRWERGERSPSPFYQEKLCRLYHLSAEELGFIHLPDRPISKEGEDMERSRREFLRLFAAAGTSLMLPRLASDWERIEGTVSTPSRLDTDLLHDLAAVNAHYWHVYRAARAKGVVLDGAVGHLRMLTQLLTDSHSPKEHQHLCALVSDVAQLAGEIFFDGKDAVSAQACYTFAVTAAREAAHYDLWACALARNAYLPLYTGAYQDALTLAHEAQRVAAHGDLSLASRCWGAAIEAEASAGLGRRSACLMALDRANAVLNSSEVKKPTWLRFDSARLPALRGACFVRLQNPDAALSALQEALALVPAPTRRRALVLIDLAHACVQQQELEQACAYGEQAIAITRHGTSGMLRDQLQQLRQRLESFAGATAVKQLDQQLELL